MNKYIRHLSNSASLLHLDGIAGLTVGIALFALNDWISQLYAIPLATVLFLATANMCYGIYALFLAFSVARTPASITLLAYANCTWVLVCGFIFLHYLSSASVIGLGFIFCEAVFVGLLAFYEYKYRFSLAAQNSP